MISQQLKGILPDDPFANVTFSDDDEEEEEDNFSIDKILKQTKNKVSLLKLIFTNFSFFILFYRFFNLELKDFIGYKLKTLLNYLIAFILLMISLLKKIY